MDHLDDKELETIALLLSGDRLHRFLALTGSTRAAIALHQQTLRLGGSLMSVTAVLEIALRNAVCDRLALYFQTENWLLKPPTVFAWRDEERGRIEMAIRAAQRAHYAKLDASQKRQLDEVAFRRGAPAGISHEHRSNARQKAIRVPAGQVIAQLTLYFWKRLFSPDYDHTLWKPALKRLFPGKEVTRAAVASNLESIYQTRNRIAHHEPVYGNRLDDALGAIDFIAAQLGTARSDGRTPLGKMLEKERSVLGDQAAALRGRIDALRSSGGTQTGLARSAALVNESA
ncbi:Abi family protein [Paraburkholderia saeva]|uniref:Abi-like protein n=1 Tax=Paraburkholderia saeva TaxID=2777537 RepID=A0A9N8X084_9BURK|nr:Abi family protein [Paraburkholderia saeva]CAG4890153.1 hypothetical protein LMG31841_01022 [Paraburkholderia saeva]CAG4893155.1 hypothetical protein R52603_01514 [Paraburkholderia saeva]CAG4915212.1 hypothetical protein R70241_04313 [Paraburkholderia saeva]